MTRSTRILAAIHLAGNALLLWLAYYWLGIGESRTSSLLWSALVALALATLSCWLDGATFVYFVGQSAGLPSSFRRALRHLLAIGAAVLIILLLYGVLQRWSDYSPQPAFNIASWLTLKLRKPVRPNSVLRVFQALTWLVRWVVLPVILVPWFAAVASQGFAGFRRRLATGRLYWIQAPVLLLCSLWIPWVLLNWVPYAGRFPLEMASFVVRLVVAYLLFVGAWLVLIFLTSRGTPVLSHAKTEARP